MWWRWALRSPEITKARNRSFTAKINKTICPIDHTLITAGQGALKDCAPGEETACIRSARGLVLRTLIVWLAFISILTLMGWMS
ncbi:hypothetical protein MNBD_GAMMA08-2756 [hydrothermal vent metagenome]|uniref:Uncharacterized protein n=1 Tax=hydrothermal vent metagenome TaxID=652676 RepID=A0A3B0XR43_9ZZZZ